MFYFLYSLQLEEKLTRIPVELPNGRYILPEEARSQQNQTDEVTWRTQVKLNLISPPTENRM